MGLRRHLVVAFAAFSLALLAVTLVPFGVVSTRAHLSAYVDQQVLETERVAASLPNDERTTAILTHHYPRPGPAAWLLDPQGESIGEATNSLAFPALATDAPEVEAARRGQADHRIGVAPLGRRLFVATPVLREGRLAAVLWISAPLRPVERLNLRTWGWAAGIGAAGTALAALIGTALARRLTRRLEVVAQGTERFGEGRFDEPVPVEGSDEIAALARRLNQMASHIDRLIRREKDFVAAASHQLRTPLAAIRIRIDEIRDLANSDDPQVAEDLDEMAQEVDRLTTLSSRFLDLSAAEHPPSSSPSPASSSIRETIARVRPLADQNSATLDLRDEAREAAIVVSPDAFEEVFFNVLDNAVKFSGRGGNVSVRATLENGFLLLQVADTGPGIPPEQRERVLEPFFRATPHGPGHGLGLAISAQLCQAVGANLELGPAPGGGTVARIRWPAAFDQ
jgi:signal transduction histidine kinase